MAPTALIRRPVAWIGAQHLMPLAGIPRNATGLVFGKAVQEQLGPLAYLLGTVIHLVFSLGWGVLFAILWPFVRRSGVEATPVALFYAMAAWIVMHALIAIVPRTTRTTSIRTSSSRVHVVLLLRGARGPDREAGARAIRTMTGRSRSTDRFESDDP